ncbi:MAG: DegV family protein [Thermobacillus sp.]|uniref:DegV family protein n=1 Tax=Thermobacillus sp. TaxID=2108467 RepID=UPI000E3AE7BD|nr:DegV family protein [Thermobacillus sp.]REK53935.1 MAG: DegV family protein [Thermobacillus sp.]
MCAVKIVVDSTSDIPAEECQRLGIEMIPLKVHFGEETYLDGVTIGPGNFYDMLEASLVMPTTSQPSPNDFLELYQCILDKDPEAQIISFHLSSEFSGTYQSAVIAKSMLEGEPDITVVDSRSASHGFGAAALLAAEMAREGASKEQILEAAYRLLKGMRIYFLVDTLEYLQRGGRIGKAAALIGGLLNIKPILTIQDGVVAPVEKTRGTKKAMNRIIEMLEEEFGRSPVHVGIGWSKYDEHAKELLARVQEKFDVRSVRHVLIGGVIGAHVGPGTSAVFMYKA